MTRQEKIGDCELYLGDCLEVMQDLPVMDCAIFDPPYKMEIHERGFAAKRDYYKELGYGTSTEFKLSDQFYKLLLSKLNEKNITIFCNKLMKLDVENWAVNNKFYFDELVLCKEAPAPLTNNQWLPDKEFAVHIFNKLKVRGDYKTKRTWFCDSNYQDKDVDHPSPKPVYILEHIIKNVSDEGGTVFDPFMGSGSCAIACMKQKRKFVGIEIDPKFYESTLKRIENHYNQKELF